MNIKILSTILDHASSAATLNTYFQVTDEMRQKTAVKIDRDIAKAEVKRIQPLLSQSGLRPPSKSENVEPEKPANAKAPGHQGIPRFLPLRASIWSSGPQDESAAKMQGENVTACGILEHFYGGSSSKNAVFIGWTG